MKIAVVGTGYVGLVSSTCFAACLASRLQALLGESLAGKRIAVFGLTFKAETDDIRDTPSVMLIHALQSAGASVSTYDPMGMRHARTLLHDVTFASDPYECAASADAAVLMTDWSCFRELDFDKLGEVMRRRVVLDLRGVCDIDQLAIRHRFTAQRVGCAPRCPQEERSIQLHTVKQHSAVAKERNGFHSLPPAELAMSGGLLTREEFVNDQSS